MPTLTRLERLRNRRLDPQIKVAGLNEAYNKLTAEDSAVQYAIGAMQPIDPDYTARTIEERYRVQKQLADGFTAMGLAVEFYYQGSVTNDTHIRAHSDVDLLTVTSKFYAVQPPNSPPVLYHGDTVADLRQLRAVTVLKLKSAYPAAKVDDTGSNDTNIYAESDVDVVIRLDSILRSNVSALPAEQQAAYHRDFGKATYTFDEFKKAVAIRLTTAFGEADVTPGN